MQIRVDIVHSGGQWQKVTLDSISTTSGGQGLRPRTIDIRAKLAVHAENLKFFRRS